MPGPAVLFREIHRLRRFAHELKEQIDRLPKQVQAQQTKVKRQEDDHREGVEAIKKTKVAVHEKEVTLKSTNKQIEKWEDQLRQVSAKKEYEALQTEMNQARKKCQQLEDEVLAALTEIDDRAAKLPEQDQAIVKARAEFARWEKAARERNAEQSAQLAETLAKLKTAEAQIPEKIRSQYNRTINAMGPDSMAVVKNRTCTACGTEIIADHYNDLLQEQFVECWSCGRILYLPEAV